MPCCEFSSSFWRAFRPHESAVAFSWDTAGGSSLSAVCFSRVHHWFRSNAGANFQSGIRIHAGPCNINTGRDPIPIILLDSELNPSHRQLREHLNGVLTHPDPSHSDSGRIYLSQGHTPVLDNLSVQVEDLKLQLPTMEAKTVVLIEVLQPVHPGQTSSEPLLPFNEALTDTLMGTWSKTCSYVQVSRQIARHRRLVAGNPAFFTQHRTTGSLVVQASTSRVNPNSFPMANPDQQ